MIYSTAGELGRESGESAERSPESRVKVIEAKPLMVAAHGSPLRKVRLDLLSACRC